MSQATDCVPLILLIGRPASGKSEIIDYLSRLEPGERRRRFHLGELQVVDDFPMLWSWFEEDQVLSELGKPRLHTTQDGYFLKPYLWDVLVRRLCLEYDKLRAAEPDLDRRATVVLEFSRGCEHGGYAQAFAHLSETVAARAAVLYVRVSFAESLRKNRRRFNPDRPHSILEHSLPDAKMERLYREDDWASLAPEGATGVRLRGHLRPCASFENEDDVTTPGGEPLGRRLQETLDRLWAQGALPAHGAKKRPQGRSPGP